MNPIPDPMRLPAEVVREDRRLDETQSRAAEALIRLRWHWTLDETNLRRVSISEYARAIGRSERIIRRDAHAHLLIVADARTSTAGGRTVTANEARERASMSEDKQAAIEAVANARGISFKQARAGRPTETRRVRQFAQERAAERGTSVEDEARKIAEVIVRREHADQRQHEQRRERLGLRFIAMEGHLTHAKRELLSALQEARNVDWEDEHRELLCSTVENVKALLGLIDMALVGTSGVDWDAELSKLAEADS